MRPLRGMRRNVILAVLTASAAVLATVRAGADDRPALSNPAIDMKGYLEVSREAAKVRGSHRVTEEQFLEMAAQPGTVILDARSRDKFDELHVKGAVNLPFPDIAVASLMPNKATRILIYCNNNFSGAEGPFPTKMAKASLNLSTFISLYTYGYTNVYELGPQRDVKLSKLPLEGTRAP